MKWAVMHDELYASLSSPTCWEREARNAVTFPSKKAAERYAALIKAGPRQFAGLGSRSTAVLLPGGGEGKP